MRFAVKTASQVLLTLILSLSNTRWYDAWATGAPKEAKKLELEGQEKEAPRANTLIGSGSNFLHSTVSEYIFPNPNNPER